MGQDTETIAVGEKNFLNREDIPEHLRPREYGKKEYLPVDVRSTIRVSQQRGAYNPAFKSIKESIKKGDIINAPDIAYLRYDALEEYLRFINKVWGDEHSIDQYEPDEEGYYHLVVAGHTRVEAMIEIEDERMFLAVEDGYDISTFPPSTINAKIYRDLQPEEILALQMDENIHEKPSQERSALAMVEMYLYGLQVGKWRTKKGFVEANEHRFSQDSLNKALVFCDLDQTTRDFVFTGAVAYGPVVELGRTVGAHRTYILRKFFDGTEYDKLDDSVKQEVDLEIAQWNASEIAHMQKKKMNITASKKRYESLRKNWEQYDPETESQEKLFVDPTREWRDQRRHTRDELRRRVAEIAQLPLSGAFQALQLHVKVMGPDTEEGAEMLTLLDSGVRNFEDKLKRVVGGIGETAVAML